MLAYQFVFAKSKTRCSVFASDVVFSKLTIQLAVYSLTHFCFLIFKWLNFVTFFFFKAACDAGLKRNGSGALRLPLASILFSQ